MQKILSDKQVVKQVLETPYGIIPANTMREALEVNEDDYEQSITVVKPKRVSTSHTAELVTMLCCGIECPECGTSFTIQASQTKGNATEPLTDEQIEEICWTEVDQRLRSFARAIEAAHGITEHKKGGAV